MESLNETEGTQDKFMEEAAVHLPSSYPNHHPSLLQITVTRQSSIDLSSLTLFFCIWIDSICLHLH